MQASLDEKFARAAELIAQADALIVGAGADMGVDSGLPDFRGRKGFWRAHPALGKRKIRFEDIAQPESFERQAWTAWGFYGHRILLYRNTVPHAGYAILREIGATKKHGVFVCTSNVDSQFQKAGFAPDRIHEIHGSILAAHHFFAPGAALPQGADPVRAVVRRGGGCVPGTGRHRHARVPDEGGACGDAAEQGVDQPVS